LPRLDLPIALGSNSVQGGDEGDADGQERESGEAQGSDASAIVPAGLCEVEAAGANDGRVRGGQFVKELPGVPG
jgi:hypothetical protein